MKRSKCFYKGLRRWKFVAEDRSVAAKDQEARSAIARDQSTTKDPKIEVLLRRIERSKCCCKSIKWSCDAEDEEIEE